MTKGLKVSSAALLRTAAVIFLAMAAPSAEARTGLEPDLAANPPTTPAIILAGQGRGGEGSEGGRAVGPEGNGSLQHGLSDAATAEIIRSLKAGEMLCGWVSFEYRADCLAQAFRLTADLARRNSEYAAVSTALRSASRDISSLVSRNADPTAERVRSHGRVYRAVKREAAPAVNAQAEAIITETETKLLRSTGSAGQAHYQRIAQAVGSTKRILRS